MSKFVIKIENKSEYDTKYGNEYYYHIHKKERQKYVDLSKLSLAKSFKTSKNAKIHLKNLLDTCVNINRCKFTIVEADQYNNIISEEKINIKKLSEELITKDSQYKGTEYYIEKLNKVMLRLNVTDYDYNWDKDSAYIKFTYKGEFYKFDHKSTLENKLTYGTDCFAQLVLTLEDLARMSERNIYDFSVWISGMKYLPEKKLLPQCFLNLGFKYDYPSREELDKAYKELLKIVHPDNGGSGESFISLKKSYEECLKQI
ncbi:MAG TPA: hypothetical protein DCW90_06805 [Lachnospiraceae bacterium]|nr:hypothetical protein [Lachnospiraceae bacterium]